MTLVTLQPEVQTPDWPYGGSTATLRIYASTSFYAQPEGVEITGGQVGSVSFCQSYSCPISGGVLTIPQVSLYTTTDSSVPTATYTAVFYDSAGRKRNTKLSQFFVDPEALQVPAESAVTVSGAGTTASNGEYTYRGQSDGKGYYNLTSYASSTTLAVVAWVNADSRWYIYATNGTSLYRSNVGTEDYPWEVGTWNATGGSLNVPTVAENPLVVSTTWEDLTLSNQGVGSIVPYQWPGPFWNVPQIKEYVNSIVGDGTTPYASTSVAGKMKISAPGSTSTNPIGVGTLDPRWTGINQTVYLSSYGFTQAALVLALADIGATQTELKITSQCSITSSLSIPSNVLVTLEGDGSFAVATGQTLTINAMTPAAAVKIFYLTGTGAVVFGKNATGGVFQVEWWVGPSTASDLSSYTTQWETSLTTGGGGIFRFGAGDWYLTDFEPPSGTILEGVGNAGGNAGGTWLKLFATGGTNPTIRISQNKRDILIRQMTVSNNGSVTAPAILGEGAGPNSTLGFRIANAVVSHTGTASIGIKINSTASSWEMFMALSATLIVGGTNGIGISCNSANVGIALDEFCSFYGGAGYTDIYWTDIGWIDWALADARGSGALAPTSAADRTITATVAAGANAVVTKTAGTAFTANDLAQRYTQGAVDSYFNEILTSTTATIADGGAGEGSGTGTIYRWTPNTGMPKAMLWANGPFVNINVHGGADEGYQYFFINDHSSLRGTLNMAGVTQQAQLKLNQTCTVNRYGCNLYSQNVVDGASASARISDYGCNITNQSAIAGISYLLTEPYQWGIHDGTSFFLSDFNTRIVGSTSGSLVQTKNAPLQVYYGAEHASIPQSDVPVVGSATLAGVDKPHLRLGLLDPLTLDWLIYYDIERDASTGWLTFAGNQAEPGRGYDFNSLLAATSFIGDSVTPAQITSTQNNYAPGNQFFQRWSSDASRNVTGISITGTTPTAGQRILIANVGLFDIVLQNQNAGSDAGSRFACVTGADIVLAAGELAYLVYDGTAFRWRVAKLNITGVTSTSTATTLALPVTASSTLAVTGATTLNADTTLAGGSDLIFTGTTGQSKILMTDNLADALTIGEAANAYLTFVTTNSSEKITAVKALVGSSSITSTSATGGIGYATGAGGAQTQATDKSTGVTSNTITTAITMNSATLNADTTVSFTFTNSTIAATDQVIVTHQSAGTAGAYNFAAFPSAGSAVISVRNVTAGNLGEAIVLRVSVYKAVSA